MFYCIICIYNMPEQKAAPFNVPSPAAKASSGYAPQNAGDNKF